MIIQVDGAGSINKGAQLMLMAVMQEIKRVVPDAKLVVNHPNAGDSFVRTYFGDNCIIKRKGSFYRIATKLHLVYLSGLFSRRLSCFFTTKHAYKGVDVVFNIGGFQFGDQWHHSKKDVYNWRDYLRQLQRYGTKIIFFPQAFGPFKEKESKMILSVINEYSNLIMARDDISYKYLVDGGANKEKLLLYPDFTGLVKGIETDYSREHKGKVCIIPNSKMIETATIDKEIYISAIVKVIKHIYFKGYEVVLLNHEGVGDYKLCEAIAAQISDNLAIVNGLNSIETKGIIASSYLVISSRFHGVANALSSCVPCLATSWSHKYQKLFDDYGQRDCIFDLSDETRTMDYVDYMLDPENNKKVRKNLLDMNSEVTKKTSEMWNVVWGMLLNK